MDNSARYRREQDLIFQQMEEMERLEAQAFAAAQDAIEVAHDGELSKFIVRLCKAKAFRELMANVTDEQKVEIIQACVEKWKAEHKTSGTQI